MGPSFISGLLGFLCTCMLLYVVGLVAILILLIARTFSWKSKAKGPSLPGRNPPCQAETPRSEAGLAFGGQETSMVQSCRKRTRKDMRGATTHSDGVEGSTKNLKDGWEKPHGGSHHSGKEASARELPREPDVAQGGNSSAATSSEHPGNQLPNTDMKELTKLLMKSLGMDTEELITLLMEPLDVTQICLDLLDKLQEGRDCTTPVHYRATRKEYLICLQCGQCFTDHCPRCQEPMADWDLPTLTAILRTVDLLIHEEDLQLELGLGFELAIKRELVFSWERTQQIPGIPPERHCKGCHSPLPKSHGDNQIQQSDTTGAAPQPVGYGGSHPTEVSRGLWPFSSEVLEQLLRAGTEPLPQVVFRGVGTGISLQRIRQCWHKVKARAWRTMEEECHWLWIIEEPAPSSTREGHEKLPLHLQRKVDAHRHVTLMEV